MTKSKQSKADLMYITGVMLIFCAIPVGVEMVFLFHHDVGNWHWAIIAGSAMTIAMGFIGGLFFSIANIIILKRRQKMKKERIHDDVA
jgi:hypothetical protein